MTRANVTLARKTVILSIAMGTFIGVLGKLEQLSVFMRCHLGQPGDALRNTNNNNNK